MRFPHFGHRAACLDIDWAPAHHDRHEVNGVRPPDPHPALADRTPLVGPRHGSGLRVRARAAHARRQLRRPSPAVPPRRPRRPWPRWTRTSSRPRRRRSSGPPGRSCGRRRPPCRRTRSRSRRSFGPRSGRLRRWPRRLRRPRRRRSTSPSARSTCWAASTPRPVATAGTSLSASVRSAGAAGLIADHGVEILGTQELQDDQLAGAQSRTGSGRLPRHRVGAGGDRQLDPVRRRPGSTFVSGTSSSSRSWAGPRPQPILRLQERATGREFYVVNTHPSADDGRYLTERRHGQDTLVSIVNGPQGVRTAGPAHRRHERPRGVLLPGRAPAAGLVASNGGSAALLPPPPSRSRSTGSSAAAGSLERLLARHDSGRPTDQRPLLHQRNCPRRLTPPDP